VSLVFLLNHRKTELMNSESAPQPIFHQCDLRDQSAIEAVFKEHEGKGGIWAVVHLAALKAVGESGEIPLDYYKVNVGGSLNLIEVSTNLSTSLHGARSLNTMSLMLIDRQ